MNESSRNERSENIPKPNDGTQNRGKQIGVVWKHLLPVFSEIDNVRDKYHECSHDTPIQQPRNCSKAVECGSCFY